MLRNGILAAHPVVYVFVGETPPHIVGSTSAAVTVSITRTLSNINAAVVSGRVDTVRDGLRYNAHPATVADCCALLGVPQQTEFAEVLSYKPTVLWLLCECDDVCVVCAAIQCFGCHAHRNLLPSLQAAAAMR